MFRMPYPGIMKAIHVGAFGVRKLAFSTRERSDVAPLRISWREQTLGVPTCFRARASVARTRSASSTVNFGAPCSLFRSKRHTDSAIFSTYRQNSGASVTVSSALKQSVDVAADGGLSDEEMDLFVDVAHKMADAAGDIIRPLFRTKIDILDKDDSSPVTVADKRAEHAMSSLITQHFPTHAIYGEEGGLHMPDRSAEHVWVLDPIDGTKSFITGKPLFGTLIALVHKGVPILGIIDQPVLRERWVGRAGKGTTLNGEPIASRSSTSALKDAYLYTTSPHFFAESKEAAFIRVRDKVKTPLYGCDCYAYGLLAAGHTDLVIESGLKPYDFLALVPVIEGAGGYITDWDGQSLRFWPNSDYPSVGDGGTEVAAAGSALLHKAALTALDWK